MSNLKGSTFDKQILNATHRLAAFKQARHGTNSHKTHSDATRIKRDMYLKNFKKFAEENELDGKLNTLMTEENLTELFEQRLEGLSCGTQEDYLRGWSGMIQGLQQTNISINVDVSFFNKLVGKYKETAIANGESIGEPKLVTTSFHPTELIKELPLSLSVIAQLQYETGFRVSEAYDVINNLERYLDKMKLHSVKGKGGQVYIDKIISIELRIRLIKLQQQLLTQQINLPVQSTYYRHLQRYDMSSHDIRAFYTKELYEEKIREGLSHKDACLYVSKEINHHRISITEYYLSKFGSD